MQHTTTQRTQSFDLVLVGGGLQSGLIALLSLHAAPGRSVALVERADELAGNHTWCLHPEDLPPQARPALEPLLVHRWSGYDVRFPRLRRTLKGQYAAVTSRRLAARVTEALSRSERSRCVLGKAARAIEADRVTLDDGSELRGRLVVDARGPESSSFAGRCGYQKFLGLELELAAPHRLERPLLMDARVQQQGGFRFFYVLPFSPTRLLIEDTAFSHEPELDGERSRGEIIQYAERLARVRSVEREESGVLPMPWMGCEALLEAAPLRGPLVAGYRGGFFHPATGYSFPCAVRVACHVAGHAPDRALGDAWSRLRRDQRSQARYAQWLNWLVFHCFSPGEMRNVFERFYALPEPLIHRFHAMTSTTPDRLRILSGKPPRGMSLAALLRAGQTERSIGGGAP